MHEYKPARFRRFLAWILDWVVCGMIPWCLLGIPDLLGVSSFSLAPLGIAAALGFFASFLCRDYLLGGRSVGKRLLGLTVVDRRTGEVVTGGKLVLRNLFLFVYPVDGGFLLFSGRSLGERATETAVIRSRQRCPVRAKPIVIVTAIVLAISLPFCALFYGVLRYAQTTESYQICYSYLVQSDAFAAQGADAEDVSLNGFSRVTEVTEKGPETICTYTFRVEDTTYTVTCHPSGESWAVCDDCTEFE